MGGSDWPEEWKVVNRKGKEKAKNTVVELVTCHLKDFSTNNTKKI